MSHHGPEKLDLVKNKGRISVISTSKVKRENPEFPTYMAKCCIWTFDVPVRFCETPFYQKGFLPNENPKQSGRAVFNRTKRRLNGRFFGKCGNCCLPLRQTCFSCKPYLPPLNL
jgi:hypothetical protein